MNIGEFVDLSFIAGFFINPASPGVYAWIGTALSALGDNASFVPRTGYTNQITIRDCAVGGYITPIDKATILAPYLALVGLVTGVSFVIFKRRKPE